MSDEIINISCPNCGFEFPGDFSFCPECGQKNEESVMSFKGMFFDLLGAFFSFDTKAVRSLPRLLFLPGTLTKEYVRGKRETYLAPFRLYLFTSIVLFLLLPLVVKDEVLFSENALQFTEESGDSTVVHEVPLQDVVQGIRENVEEVLDTVETGDAEADSIIDILRKNANFDFSVNKNESVISIFGSDDSTADNSWKNALTLIDEGSSIDEVVDSLFADQSGRNKFFIKQGLKLQSQRGEGLVSSFLDVTSYTLFIFLPLFALLLKLLYIRRKRYYIEHLVFSLHYFSYFFFLIILYILFYKFLFQFQFWIVFIITLLYLYFAMYRFYGQSWWKTFFKYFGLLFTTTALFLPIFFVIAVAISLVFY